MNIKKTLILIFILTGNINAHDANPYMWTLDCSGKPLTPFDDFLLPNEITVEKSNDDNNVFRASWITQMSVEKMDQITKLTINGCKLEHLEDVPFKSFPNLEFLSLNDIGRTEFDLHLLELNTFLRELHLNDNKQLEHLSGTISTGLKTLNLNNTSLENFPEVIFQFKHCLKRLDISGNKGGVNETEVCAEFEELELLNGKLCGTILRTKSTTTTEDQDDNNSISISRFYSSFLLLICIILGVVIHIGYTK